MEEEELIEDSGGGAARRFDFPLSGAGEGLEKFGSDSVLHDVSGIVQEGGQENVLESMDKRIQPEIEVDTGGTGEEIRDHPINEMQGIVLTIEADDRATLEGKGSSFEVTDVVVMECAGIENIEEEELARETTGLIEKLRDEGRDDRRELHEVADKGAQPELKKATGKNSEDVETPVEAKDALRKGKKKGKEKEKIVENRVEKEKRKQKEKNNESASSARNVEAAGKAMKEQSQTDRLREEDKESANDAAVSASRTSAGNVLRSSQTVNGSAKTSETHPGKETNLPPYEGPEGGEKNMEADRGDAGYRRLQGHSTGITPEELKALYLFTGVDPPESFKDISSLDELN